MKLRECPFCGEGEPFTEMDGGGNYVVVCRACDACGPPSLVEDEAERGWSVRASDRYTITEAGKAMLRGAQQGEG